MTKYTQEVNAYGEKSYVELKHEYRLGMGKVFPKAEASEIGGYRIILPDGNTTFVFYSNVERTFSEEIYPKVSAKFENPIKLNVKNHAHPRYKEIANPVMVGMVYKKDSVHAIMVEGGNGASYELSETSFGFSFKMEA